MFTAPPGSFEAIYFDGCTPVRHAARAHFTPHSLRVELSDGAAHDWSYDTLILTGGRWGEPARIQPAGGLDGESLSVSDPLFLESFCQYAPSTGSLGPRLAAVGWRATALCCAGIAAIFVFLYSYGIRWAAETAAPFTPISVERRLGATATAILAPPGQRCSDPARERLLASIADRLADAAGSLYPFEILYVRNPMMNAFAAPGGYIVVFDGLLEGTETPEEFAGVLAHEMQHVLKHHSTRALARRLSGRSLLSLMAVDWDGSNAALEASAALAGLQHQRSDEDEADRDSIPLLVKAHIDTGGLAAFLRRLHAVTGSTEPPPYLSTHPPTLDRAARLAEAARRSEHAVEPLMSISEWEDARQVCRP